MCSVCVVYVVCMCVCGMQSVCVCVCGMQSMCVCVCVTTQILGSHPRPTDSDSVIRGKEREAQEPGGLNKTSSYFYMYKV